MDDKVTLTSSVGTVTQSGTNENGRWSWSFGTTDGPAESQEVTITANDGTVSVSATFELTVNNAAPNVGSITIPAEPVLINTTVKASVSFTDAGILDTHTAVWDWGDGTTSQGTISETSGSGEANGNHVYTTVGIYQVKVTVADKDNSSSESIYQYVVVYDPDAGFVTGGGWFNSPAGAYAANSSVTGKANFSFDSKYKKDSVIPTGQMEFQLKDGGINFHSTAYEWLIINGSKAQFKGVGTINGAGDYGIMVTAVIGETNGKEKADKLGIKIWDKKNNDVVIYDNLIGINAAEPDTVTNGGSIVIHKN